MICSLATIAPRTSTVTMLPTKKLSQIAPSREPALIQSLGLSTVIHDLVGITSALELRLQVVESAIPAADRACLSTVVGQLRALSRTMRLLQEPEGPSDFSPSRQVPLDEWWRLVASLTYGVLPRGVTVRAQLPDHPVSFAVAGALTQIWLLACGALTTRYMVGGHRCVVDVSAECAEQRVQLSASLPAGHVAGRKRGTVSRWHRQAMRIAEPLNAELQWWTSDAHTATWRCCTTTT